MLINQGELTTRTQLVGLAQKLKHTLSNSLGIHERRRFRGSFSDHAEAIDAVRSGAMAGYDNNEIAQVSFEEMCKVSIWDYPIIYWLGQLLQGQTRLIDAGGHMGTKFRAFTPFLALPAAFDWAILDVPAVVRAGRELAQKEGIKALTFYDRAEDLPESEVLLASGLFQYLDESPSDFLARLKRKPQHFLINKVATREGPDVVTLERFPGAEVPYQVRNRAAFERDIKSAGYFVRDQWIIPSISRHHKAFGHMTSRGYYLELGE